MPLLEQLADGMGGVGGAQLKQQIQALKPLLSVEMVNILQLLGFTFRQGIGAPSTQRLRALIDGSGDASTGVQTEVLHTQRAAMELATDPAAYARFREMYPAS